MNTLTKNNAPKATGKLADADTVDVTTDLRALETLSDIVEGEAAEPKTPAATLADMRLSHVALALLDKAMVNAGENDGKGLPEEGARAMAAATAGIIKNCGYDLKAVIELIVTSVPDPDSVRNMVYKQCYNVQKALNFIGNIAYRRALDPKSDFDLEAFVDYREEEREAPYGLAPVSAFDINDRRYQDQPDHEIIADALEEVHLVLQLITESFGWDATQMMPYLVIQEKDESFTPVHDCIAALDIMEVRYKESRAKRQAKQLSALQVMQAASLAMLTGKKAATA